MHGKTCWYVCCFVYWFYGTWLTANQWFMMASSNGNIFRVTGHLLGGSTGHWWILLTKGSDAEFWHFRRSAPEQMVEQTIDTPLIWDAVALIMTSLWWLLRIKLHFGRHQVEWGLDINRTIIERVNWGETLHRVTCKSSGTRCLTKFIIPICIFMCI